MGDARFSRWYERVRSSADKQEAVNFLADDEVIQALAAASREGDPLLANVLATEAMNRMLRTRGIVTSMAEGATAIDEMGVCTFLNPAGERILGWREAELRGFELHEMAHYLDEKGQPLPKERCRLSLAARSGETLRDAEETFIRRDGSRVRVLITVAPLTWMGESRGAVCTFREV